MILFWGKEERGVGSWVVPGQSVRDGRVHYSQLEYITDSS